MKFDPECAVDGIVGEPGRFAIDHAFVEDGQLVATNGQALAIVPCGMSADDVPGCVPVNAIKAARALHGEVILEGERAIVPGDDGEPHIFPRLQDGRFPPWRDVVPCGRAEICVGLNAELLHQLAKAIGASDGKVCLRLDADNPSTKAIAVSVITARDVATQGVLMPVSLIEW